MPPLSMYVVVGVLVVGATIKFEYVPAALFEHAVAPDAEYVLRGQEVQLAAFVEFEKDMAGQVAHCCVVELR